MLTDTRLNNNSTRACNEAVAIQLYHCIHSNAKRVINEIIVPLLQTVPLTCCSESQLYDKARLTSTTQFVANVFRDVNVVNVFRDDIVLPPPQLINSVVYCIVRDDL